MFWRSVVGKLAITILLLVSFVLFILTILLLEFFEDFHTQETEKGMIETATKVSIIMETHDNTDLIIDTTERVKNPSSRIVLVFEDDTTWTSESSNKDLSQLQDNWYANDEDFQKVVIENKQISKQMLLPDSDAEIMIVGTPVANRDGAVFIYESLDVVEQTKAETTRFIFLAAGIAIILTTVFAFFLSTRITAPLIKMREAAFDLARGEFNTKVPILTHDEIGELAMAFNKMGKQLVFHMQALRQEKEQLSSIVISMADGVITLNRNGDMIVTNPPAEKFLKDWYFENNIQVKKQARPLPQILQDILEEVIAEENEVMQEINLQGRDWVMIMTPLYDQLYVRGAVAVIRDMTEERRLDTLRTDFIANVSHELRTPISLLQGYSEAIVDDIAGTREDKNELAQIIHDESLRMGRLVNELLDLASIDAGHIEENSEQVNLDEFAERIIKKFEGVAAEKNIELKLSTNISKNKVIFNPDQIEQVFTNLIDNAINYQNNDGYVHVQIESDDEEIVVYIEDKGIGIPEEDLPYIFERFYKADKSRKRNSKKKGTGLGLAIARKIILAHQGTISVKSNSYGGTTFTFRIPQNHN